MTGAILIGVAVVLGAVYMMKRNSRMKAEE
jgi:hypothetical protein